MRSSHSWFALLVFLRLDRTTLLHNAGLCLCLFYCTQQQEENEKILIAFKGRGGIGRDKSYFTTHRILIKDGKGIGNKRKNYQTIWYKHIKGFAIETAGSFDGDVELHVYASAGTSVQIDFAKGQVDVSEIGCPLVAFLVELVQCQRTY
jgi:hypothetical protein